MVLLRAVFPSRHEVYTLETSLDGLITSLVTTSPRGRLSVRNLMLFFIHQMSTREERVQMHPGCSVHEERRAAWETLAGYGLPGAAHGSLPCLDHVRRVSTWRQQPIQPASCSTNPMQSIVSCIMKTKSESPPGRKQRAGEKNTDVAGWHTPGEDQRPLVT